MDRDHPAQAGLVVAEQLDAVVIELTVELGSLSWDHAARLGPALAARAGEEFPS